MPFGHLRFKPLHKEMRFGVSLIMKEQLEPSGAPIVEIHIAQFVAIDNINARGSSL
jgi:hypothetical protein